MAAGGDEAMTMTVAVEPDMTITLQLRPVVDLSDEVFLALCAQNPDLRLERTAEGEIVVMPPSGGTTGNRNAALTAALHVWSRANGTGSAFDSSTGFRLPNGAIRAPDASWVRAERLDALAPTERDKFLPLCPDFVVELRSATDRLARLHAKMTEYAAHGARLGWLIDPVERVVYVYRPGRAVVRLFEPRCISGDRELPGFTLDLTEIWSPFPAPMP